MTNNNEIDVTINSDDTESAAPRGALVALEI
jgi:hypothetical protein